MNIYGASGHAKVIIEIIESVKGTIDVIFDKNPQITNILGYEVTCSADEVVQSASASIVAIGNNRIRREVAAALKGPLVDFLAHSSAVISPSTQIGNGTVIMALATVNAEAIIGENCIINTGSVVEHEAILEDFVHISPNAAVAGNVKIGEGTHIGTCAAVIPGITIGKWVTVGAGAVIIKDIPDFATVVGNPGRIIDSKSVFLEGDLT